MLEIFFENFLLHYSLFIIHFSLTLNLTRRLVLKRAGIAVLLIALLFIVFTERAVANDSITTDERVIINGKNSETRSTNPTDDVKTITPISDSFNKLTDYPNGYSVNYPNHMHLDVHLSPVHNLIFDETTQIEIYYDNLNNSLANVWSYIYYSNGFLNNTTDHFKENESLFNHNGYVIHTAKWNRNKLEKIENDKNYYLSAEIIKNNKEVYSLFFKSSEPLKDEICLEMIKSFRIIERKGQVYMDKLPEDDSIKSWNEETQTFYNNYFIDATKLTWGIFDNFAPDYLDYFKKTEDRLDFKFDFLVRYHNLPSEQNLEVLKSGLEKAYKDERYVQLTLQTSRQNDQEGNMVYDILNGEYDAYFKEYAEMLKAFEHPVLFRLNNEMNGDWCLYSSYYTSKDPMIYKELYRYIYRTFEENEVDNVIWIWNPHDKSFPDFRWNDPLAYYPGDSFVDVIGMTGYNTGNYYPGEVWRGFQEIYDELYMEYDKTFNKPFMITEFGSNSVGGNKEEWVMEMFENISKYERIKAAIWWNGCDYDTQGRAARIYRLDDNPALINIFRKNFQEFK